MIKLLIIDDEQATRKGLVKHVDWLNLGIDQVEEARDGLEGLEVAGSYQPDIIISDIYMPGMNGIELANHIKELLPSCKVVFLSGYSDKEYLKAAISLNAVSYLEKPINLDEVRDAVRKAVTLHLDEEGKKLAEKKMHTALSESLPLIKQNLITGLINRKTSYNELVGNLSLIDISFEPKDAYAVMIIKITMPQEQSTDEAQEANNEALRLVEECLRETKHICALEDSYHMVVILSSPRTFQREWLQACINEIKMAVKGRGVPCLELFFAVGLTVSGMDQIWHSYHTARLALQKLFYLGYGSIVFYEKKSEEPMCMEGISACMEELLQKQDSEKLISFIENLCKEISKHQETAIDEVKNIFVNLTFLLFREAEKRGVDFNDSKIGKEKYIWSQISGFQTLEELKQYLLGNMAILFDRIEGLQSTSRAVYKALDYIKRNYTSCNISNQILADYVYLTPSYLSALFKKETGKTISDFIIEIRVEKSKELLKKPRVKLFEIAREVGYSDANYYAKVFKQHVGLTPSEYREKYKS